MNKITVTGNNNIIQGNNKELTLNQYQKQAMTTCMESSKNLDYALCMTIGELGEAMEKTLPEDKSGLTESLLEVGEYAKNIRKGKQIPEDVKIINNNTFNKEIGDILWGIALLCELQGITLEEVAQINLDKLASRQERNVIDGDGDNR